jgi:hypothetical protein
MEFIMANELRFNNNGTATITNPVNCDPISLINTINPSYITVIPMIVDLTEHQQYLSTIQTQVYIATNSPFEQKCISLTTSTGESVFAPKLPHFYSYCTDGRVAYHGPATNLVVFSQSADWKLNRNGQMVRIYTAPPVSLLSDPNANLSPSYREPIAQQPVRYQQTNIVSPSNNPSFNSNSGYLANEQPVSNSPINNTQSIQPANNNFLKSMAIGLAFVAGTYMAFLMFSTIFNTNQNQKNEASIEEVKKETSKKIDEAKTEQQKSAIAIAKLEEEIKNLKESNQSVTNLKAQIKALDQELVSLKNSKEPTNTQSQVLTERRKDLETKVSDLQAESNQSQTIARELQKQLKGLPNKSDFDSLVKQLDKESKKLESNSKVLRENLDRVNQTLEDLSKQFNSIKAEVEKHSEEIKAIQDKAKEIETKTNQKLQEFKEWFDAKPATTK